MQNLVVSLDDIPENSIEVSISPPSAPTPIPEPFKAVLPSLPLQPQASHTIQPVVLHRPPRPVVSGSSRPNALTGPRPANSARKNPNPKGSKRAARVVTEAVSSASFTSLVTPTSTSLVSHTPPVADAHSSRSQGYTQKPNDRSQGYKQKSVDRPFPRHLAAPSRDNSTTSERSQAVPFPLPPIRSIPHQAVQPPRLNSQYAAAPARSIPQFAAQSSLSKPQHFSQLSRTNTRPLPQPSHQPSHQPSRRSYLSDHVRKEDVSC